MKSKYLFWMVGLLTLVSCKELTCEFSYAPVSPVAGQVVTFSNMSTGADDYAWDFGDNGISTTANPTHIYRKPGTYTVSLTIKRNKTEKRTRTQHITVLDTVPSLACDSSIIRTFTPVKFYAKIYNPWRKVLTYRWTMPEQAVLVAGKSLDSSAVVCYFTQPDFSSQVSLTIQMNDEEPVVLKDYPFTTVHQPGSSVVYATELDSMEQFTYSLYSHRLFRNPILCNPTSKQLLKAEQDTVYQYGPNKYTVAVVNSLLNEDVKGFQVDRLMAKIYAYGNAGLWVSNMQGENKRQLVKTGVRALKVDGDGNCLYWATDEGLFCHRLLRTKDNQETVTTDTVTIVYKNITKISVNSNLH